MTEPLAMKEWGGGSLEVSMGTMWSNLSFLYSNCVAKKDLVKAGLKWGNRLEEYDDKESNDNSADRELTCLIPILETQFPKLYSGTSNIMEF